VDNPGAVERREPVARRRHVDAEGGLRAHPAPDAGACAPGAVPSRTADAALDLLDQWSRPSVRAPGVRPESPIPMPSRLVKPAGNRHSYGGSSLALTPQARQGCAGQRQGVPGWRFPLPSALEAASPLGLRRDRNSVRRILTCPASWGEDGHSRAGCPGTTGILPVSNRCLCS
jgi:hypothetical protein